MASSVDKSNKSPESPEKKWKLAKEGINLLINNKGKEAEKLFLDHSDHLQMYAGYAIVVFMDALMTFEDDKLELAMNVLKETEKKCSTDRGWFKTVKSKVFGTDSSESLSEYLESQIILADSLVFLSTLSFLQQDLTGYFKGGWILRKSWKLYQHTYTEISRLYKELVGDPNLPDANVKTPSPKHLKEETANNFSSDSTEIETFKAIGELKQVDSPVPPINGKHQNIDKETITRLMGAVCFGYGLFQLGVSLLPPTLLKITNILGFSGNRQTGIENLMFARTGTDMRAPLATLALLWYHTIVRPFYALDGSNVQAGVDSATELINESLKDYGESSLFLFFRGRIERLKSDITSALQSFEKSVRNATQREMKILSKHELGWCYLIQLDFVKAEATFQYMKRSSRWSRSFYAYLATISAGTYNNFKDFSQLEHMRESLERAPKGTQLEEFLLRRFRICPKDATVLMNTSAIFWRMLVYELLYLWNTLPSCSSNNIEKILAECEFSKEEEVMVGLGKLISGVCYCIHQNFERGIYNFRYCLELRKSIANNAPDAHISAFAQYELALLLLKEQETKQEGKVLLQHMSQYKDYDFEQRLSVRIHMILKHL